MSLNFAPIGFVPIRTLNGGDVRLGYYTVASTSLRIFKGDPVALSTLGLITKWRASSTKGLIGVAADDTGVLAGQVTKFPVYDDPNTVYECQSSIATAVTQAKFGSPFRVASTVSARLGNTTLGHSKAGVALATTAQSASYVVFAIRLSPKQDNDLSAYSVIECILRGDPTKAPSALN